MASTFNRTVTTKPAKVYRPLVDGGAKSGALVALWPNGIQAVVKVKRETVPNGKSTQRGLPVDTLHRREVAFYNLSLLFGFDTIVPETCLINFAGHEASAQLFMPAFRLADLEPGLKDRKRADWEMLLRKTAMRAPKVTWLQMVILDLVAASRDRHLNNAGFVMRLGPDGPQFRPLGWDNSASFGGYFTKYHNVFHKYLFRYTMDLGPYWSKLENVTRSELAGALDMLSKDDVEHAYRRIMFMLEYPYRLPWRVCSQGKDGADMFPDYESFFVQGPQPQPAPRAVPPAFTLGGTGA